MSKKLSWYDSWWLNAYIAARDCIAGERPEKLNAFEQAIEPLRTRPDFEVQHIPDLFDQAALQQINQIIAHIPDRDLLKSEFFTFGRRIIRNHEFFNDLQQSLVPMVSRLVKEEVESEYNFLSLYNNFGVCGPHLDAPYAKWTLDACINQSSPWPIYFSRVTPWPENIAKEYNHANTKSDFMNEIDFQEVSLLEGEAVIFSGSSQWHYRERIPQTTTNNFCHLLFFHFIPKGSNIVVDPRNWPDLFDVPEIFESIKPFLARANE